VLDYASNKSATNPVEKFVSQALVTALQNPALFDHDVESFELIETHISWVILTGPYAYKIKKPMDFGFLDFTTLEKRKHFCEEELRLNRRLAPELYLDLLPLYGDESNPSFAGDGTVLEYAIKMRQFEQANLLNNLLAEGKLNHDHINEVATQVADFHARTEVARSDTRFGEPEQVMEPVQQNFDQIRPLLSDANDLQQLDQIEAWAQDTFTLFTPTIIERKASGKIRACHGDLHLGNITQYENQIRLFDCIEFNDDFYWIDVIREAAFFIMDLEDRGEDYFANQFLNRYLELTSDYAGLKLLNFYKSYYAMVRAKVGLFQLFNESISDEDREAVLKQYRSYTALAEHYMEIPCRCLILMHGYSGTGKSTVSGTLMEHLHLVRVRSDVVRKQLFGEQNGGPADTLNSGIYSQTASDKTFQHLQETAETILLSGHSALIDATFLKAGYRDLFHELGEKHGVPVQIVSCTLDDITTRARLAAREAQQQDVSDATVKVYEAQLESADPLSDKEEQHTLHVNTSEQLKVDTFIERLDRWAYRVR